MSGMIGITVPALNCDAEDLPTDFWRFRNHVNHVFNGPLAEQNKEVKALYLMLWLGPNGITIGNFQVNGKTKIASKVV